MKKHLLSVAQVAAGLALVFGLGSVSCTKTKNSYNSTAAKQDLISGNLKLTIPVLPSNGEYDSICAVNFMINMDSFVKSFDSKYAISSIQDVRLISCELLLDDGTATNNFANFHTANIGISSAANGAITRMAVKNDIVDTNAYYLNIPVYNNPNLASYFRCDSICYRLYGNMRRKTTQPVNMTANLRYQMTLAN